MINVVYTTEPERYGCLVSSKLSNSTSFHHFDVTGSTRQLTDVAANKTDALTFDAWGKLAVHTGTSTSARLWIAELTYYTDAETGLTWVLTRPYSPATALWLTMDALRFVSPFTHSYLLAVVAPFAYAANSPLQFVDPSGMTFEAIADEEGEAVDSIGVAHKAYFGFTLLTLETVAPIISCDQSKSDDPNCCSYWQCRITTERELIARSTWRYLREGALAPADSRERGEKLYVAARTVDEERWHEPVHVRLNIRAAQLVWDNFYIPSMAGSRTTDCKRDVALARLQSHEARIYQNVEKQLSPDNMPKIVAPANQRFHQQLKPHMTTNKILGEGRDSKRSFLEYFHGDGWEPDMDALYRLIVPDLSKPVLNQRAPCCQLVVNISGMGIW